MSTGDDWVTVIDLSERQRFLLRAVVERDIVTKATAKRPEILAERAEMQELAKLLANVTGLAQSDSNERNIP